MVTPFVGVWIEIVPNPTSSWELTVTPFVGVWIEIIFAYAIANAPAVTPFVGVWIEIVRNTQKHPNVDKSLPSWECGVKWKLGNRHLKSSEVTPFVGVWIEMAWLPGSPTTSGHSLRGSVD